MWNGNKLPSTTIKVVTPEEKKQWFVNELKEKGLYEAVKDQLDELMIDCRALDYLGFSHAVECSCNILDLIQTFVDNYGFLWGEDNPKTNPECEDCTPENMNDCLECRKRTSDKGEMDNEREQTEQKED